MARLTIRILPDPVLRQIAEPVLRVDARIAQLMEDMLDTMYPVDGMGIAANQVGVLERVIVCDRGDGLRDHALRMANPVILEQSKESFTHREGCLSIPDQFAEITRPKRIRVAYRDQHDHDQVIEAEDVLAICIQHEIDHLNGVMFIDHLSRMKRDIILRKLDKARKLIGPEGFYPAKANHHD